MFRAQSSGEKAHLPSQEQVEHKLERLLVLPRYIQETGLGLKSGPGFKIAMKEHYLGSQDEGCASSRNKKQGRSAVDPHFAQRQLSVTELTL